MLFNSLHFAVFLVLAFGIYWGLLKKTVQGQNIFLLIISYVFYGWWDWRFLSLIVISSAVDYLVGLNLSKEKEKRKRKRWLAVSLAVNLGLLGFFKYFNFFIDSLKEGMGWIGQETEFSTLDIILPVGISFYTFQTLSYSIDLYRGKMEVERDPIKFFAYVSFFPQLVAGPIERAAQLLPQFSKERFFEPDKAVGGMRQILWGLFKKIVIADNCGIYVDYIFDHADAQPGSTLYLGTVLFAFQIYGDFSGYSDIAIGVARLFGFKLMTNFRTPFFSRNIAEFWRRWHISLSNWFRDYLYFPLGGSKGGKGKRIRNTFIIFLVSGFWHGANWTYIIWGGLHALYFLPLLLMNRNRKHLKVVAENRRLPNLSELGAILLTFALVNLGWVLFRPKTVGDSVAYFTEMISPSLLDRPDYLLTTNFFVFLPMILIMIIIDWNDRKVDGSLEFRQKWLRYFIYIFLAVMIVIYMPNEAKSFIYFQF